MLYIICGEQTNRVQKRKESIVQAMQKKRPDALFFSIDEDSFSEGRFSERLQSTSLFEAKSIVVLKNLLSTKETSAYILASLKELQMSPHAFICVEKKLTSALKKKLEMYAERVDTFDKKEGSESPFNVFSFTDALLQRDKKRAWVLYERARRLGKEPEELFGILFWQLKAIATARTSKSAKESGLKPFVYRKSLSGVKCFKKGEVEEFLWKVTELYHESRRGGIPLNEGIERFLLTI